MARSRVAIMDNGAAKGGEPSSRCRPNTPRLAISGSSISPMKAVQCTTLRTLYCQSSGPDAGNYLKLSARPDGNFEVFN
jgi:hypothetical protein